MMLGGVARAWPNTLSTPAASASDPSAVVRRTSRRVGDMRGSLLQELLDDGLVDVAAANPGVTDGNPNCREPVVLVGLQRYRIICPHEREELFAAPGRERGEGRAKQLRRDALP